MSQLDEAIAVTTKFWRAIRTGLSWVTELQAHMEAEKLSFGGRLLCPFLRPHFITRRQYDSLVKTARR